MSEVKRYDMSGYGDGMIEVPDGAFVYLEDHQSELAALREELRRSRGTVTALERDSKLIAVNLIAAEQRNAALDLEWSRTITDRGLITIELEKAKRLLERSATAMSAIRNNPSLVRDIDNFLKPTESGASE